MPIHYVVRQDMRRNGTQLFYGKAIYDDVVKTKDIAKSITASNLFTEADVTAVLTALVPKMRNHLQASHKVKLTGIGIFSLGVKSSGAVSEEELKVTQNMKRVTVNFMEARSKTGSKVTRAFADDLVFQKAQW